MGIFDKSALKNSPTYQLIKVVPGHLLDQLDILQYSSHN